MAPAWCCANCAIEFIFTLQIVHSIVLIDLRVVSPLDALMLELLPAGPIAGLEVEVVMTMQPVLLALVFPPTPANRASVEPVMESARALLAGRSGCMKFQYAISA